MERSDRGTIDLETRAVARPIPPVSARGDSRRGANRSSRGRIEGSCAAALCGVLLWFGVGSFAGTPRDVVAQPSAAPQVRDESAPARTGLSSELLDEPPSDTRSQRRAERLERRRARKEAARAKREEKREARAAKAQERREARTSTAQERRDARAAKRDARAAKLEERRDARATKAQERREAREAKREAARERYAARVQARRDAAEARREQARARRDSASQTAERAVVPGPSAVGSSGFGNAGTLQINSLPWAQVYVDGRMLGYTPQRAIALSPGEHEVRLFNPAFRMQKILRVQIAQGERVSRREILED